MVWVDDQIVGLFKQLVAVLVGTMEFVESGGWHPGSCLLSMDQSLRLLSHSYYREWTNQGPPHHRGHLLSGSIAGYLR